MTRVQRVSPLTPEPEAIKQAAEIIRAGGLVAFPTETVYGLGADVRRPEAVRRLYQVKGRPGNHPVIVHVGDVEAINAGFLPKDAIDWYAEMRP